MSSEDLFDRYSKGQLEDSIDIIEWSKKILICDLKKSIL